MNIFADVGIYHHSYFTDHPAPHKLNFMLDEGSIKIMSCDTDVLEIDAIASSLQIVINQYQEHLKQNSKPENISLLSKDDYQKTHQVLYYSYQLCYKYLLHVLLIQYNPSLE